MFTFLLVLRKVAPPWPPTMCCLKLKWNKAYDLEEVGAEKGQTLLNYGIFVSIGNRCFS